MNLLANYLRLLRGRDLFISIDALKFYLKFLKNYANGFSNQKFIT